MPEISVVLPVYNGERFLAESIQSLRDQSFDDWELIIVDDASTDGSAHIAQEFAAKDARIRLLSNPQNRQLPATLNVGFAEAKGRYLTWTSDDNIYKPEALAAMHAYLEANGDVAHVHCDYDYIDPQGKVTRVMKTPEHLSQGSLSLGFLYRREVYDVLGGYDESTFLAEDMEYWLRIAVSGRISHRLPQNLYQFRLHPKSLTCTRQKDILRQVLALWARYAEQMFWLDEKGKARLWLRIFYRDRFCVNWHALRYAWSHSPLAVLIYGAPVLLARAMPDALYYWFRSNTRYYAC